MDNAIIMASGLGSRMRPLTETIPKPLIEVKGKPMIETVIEGLLRRDIGTITVVVGYLKEQFDYLRDKYPNIQLICNPFYKTVNNISSVYVARDELEKGNCFICEADLFISDLSIFEVEHLESCYYGKMVKGHSDDWVFEQDENGLIVRVGKGGDDCYNMVGISYFLADDALRLKEAIETSYGTPGYEELFWDDVVNQNLDKLRLTVYPVQGDQIVEIDTVAELEEINKRMQEN